MVQRVIYRFVGMSWIILGGLAFLVGTSFMITSISSNNMLQDILPVELVKLFTPLVSGLPPEFEVFLVFLVGIFFIVYGVGLASLRSWARIIGIGFHLNAGFIFLCLALILNSLIISLFNLTSTGKFIYWVMGLVIPLVILVLGFQLSSNKAIETFSGQVPTPPAVSPVICPTCGSVMNAEKARCPQCDSGKELPVPKHAYLVDKRTKKEYPVSTLHNTRIGRETKGYEININEPSVSSEHAFIEFVGGHFFIHSIKDTNGIFVNDLSARVKDKEIRDGDLIVLGRAQFSFSVEE
jgi:hypothetical protein